MIFWFEVGGGLFVIIFHKMCSAKLPRTLEIEQVKLITKIVFFTAFFASLGGA